MQYGNINNILLKMLILITTLVIFIGIVFDTLPSNDANFYAIIAKNIALNNDFINLTFANNDWLDKPHIPFIITAIFFKIFGIYSFSYKLPGFIFTLIGGVYTYKLCRLLYIDRTTALLSLLMYLSAIHIMTSTADVRQEAFLLGEIIPAIYYWQKYIISENINKKPLLLGAIFTALAIMTKGIFTVLTITSGFIILSIFSNVRLFLINLKSKKTIYAILLTFVFILPEIIFLIIQFDVHPEKLVFGKQNVSGIRWFFLDSQFGRFFNYGPITNGTGKQFSQFFYFIHTFLWAFLPYSILFVFAIFDYFTKEIFNKNTTFLNKKNQIFLFGCFIPTFILFSLTKFQLDHYTNILIPFASIISANWYLNYNDNKLKHILYYIQVSLSFALIAMIIALNLFTLSGHLFILILAFSITSIIVYIILYRNSEFIKALIYPLLPIWIAFMLITFTNGVTYRNYDIGAQISDYLNNLNNNQIIDYRINSLSLEFHSKLPYKRIANLTDLQQEKLPFYLVISTLDLNEFKKIKNFRSRYKIINEYAYIPQIKFIPSLLNKDKFLENTIQVLLIYVEPHK